MNMLQSKYTKFGLLVFLLFQVVFLNACQENLSESDPFGVERAEELFEINEALVSCSTNVECPRRPDALFWHAAIIFSDMSATEIELQFSDDIVDKLIEQWNSDPAYEVDDPRFERAYKMFVLADELGNTFAANELGVLHLEQPKLINLDLSKYYFQRALEKNDAMGAYNLARIHASEETSYRTDILSLMKKAYELDSEIVALSYAFALEEFGTLNDKEQAAKIIDKYNDLEIRRERDLFNRHFKITDEN